MTTLVNQETGAPTRKVFGSFLVAIGLVAINKSVPALFPAALAHPAIAPLWDQVVTWAPLIVAAAGYHLKEWPTTITATTPVAVLAVEPEPAPAPAIRTPFTAPVDRIDA